MLATAPRDRPHLHLRARRRGQPPRVGRGRHPPGPAGVHGRRAGRQGRARGARAGAGGARELGLRVPAASASRSTSRPPTCARSGRGSTCRSPSRCSSPAAQLERRRARRAARWSASSSLNGEVRSIRGALAIAEGARRHGLRAPARPAHAGARGRARARARGARRRDARSRRSRSCAASRAAAAARRREPPADGRAAGARPRRRPRPQRADPGARGRRRRRPQPLPARPARHGQDDARPPRCRRSCRR